MWGSMVLLMFISFVLASYIRGQALAGPNLTKILVLTALVPATQFLAVLAATLPRQWVTFARTKSQGLPIMLVYLLMSVAAFVIGSILTMGGQWLMFEGPQGYRSFFGMAFAWSLLVPATALSTAHSIDYGVGRPFWRDGLVNVVALWIAMMMICVVLGVDNWNHVATRFAIAGVLGFLIGAWIPRSYRIASGMEAPVPQRGPQLATAVDGDGSDSFRPLFRRWNRDAYTEDADLHLIP
jgi:hypothetical protein